MKSGILAASMLALAGLAATSAYAYDVTTLRDTRADSARAQLDAHGFRYVGTYSDFDNEWKMWFNRRTGECAGITEKGRNISRAKNFKTDRCRDADRGGFGGRPDHDDHYGPPPGGGDHYGDRDVPRWAVGNFRGYNRAFGARVSLDISPDGNVVATVNDARSYGRFRDGVLRVGPNRFYVDRDYDGFTTRQIGNEGNVVHYHRR
ncbi:MAG TPA: hypothetical protein VIM56_03140 [Rhizomicrobium sp.]